MAKPVAPAASPWASLVVIGMVATGAAGHEPAPASAPATVAATPTPVPEPPPGRIVGEVKLRTRDGSAPGASAVVYVETADPALWHARRKAPPAEKLKMTMQAKQFEPKVLVVLAGDEVKFPNLDPVFHNVFSLGGKNRFDLGLYKDGASRTWTFREPGVVRMFCNIHPGMTAFAVVLQNPWYARPGSDGRYEIAGVSPGSYTVTVWDERGGQSSRPVEVKSATATAADFELDTSGYKKVPHKNKFGQSYSSGY